MKPGKAVKNIETRLTAAKPPTETRLITAVKKQNQAANNCKKTLKKRFTVKTRPE